MRGHVPDFDFIGINDVVVTEPHCVDVVSYCRFLAFSTFTASQPYRLANRFMAMRMMWLNLWFAIEVIEIPRHGSVFNYDASAFVLGFGISESLWKFVRSLTFLPLFNPTPVYCKNFGPLEYLK